MNYAEKNLTKGEEIVLVAKKNFGVIVPKLLWCVILLAAAIFATVKLNELYNEHTVMNPADTASGNTMDIIIYVIWGVWSLIGLLPLILKIIDILCTCLCITNKRVIGKRGVIRIQTLDYPIEKVDNITLKSGIFGSIFRYQTVIVLGGGNASEASNAFSGISNGTAFKNTVTEAIEQHAEEARKAQAEEIARAMAK